MLVTDDVLDPSIMTVRAMQATHCMSSARIHCAVCNVVRQA
jgi:hypothetical protein